MSVTYKELLSGHNISDIPINLQQNLEDLLVKINKLRVLYNSPFVITSGLRTEQDQLRIYRAKNIPDNKIPMGSAHLKGCACDVYDPKGVLFQWVMQNESHLEAIGLWVEDDPSQPRVHFQTYPPKSGKRFFKP